MIVIFFHYFSRWTQPLNNENLYPYKDALLNFPIFYYGYLGVNFFFIISGFVISLTLFNSKNWLHFSIKRFTRLYPSILLCSCITYFGLQLLPIKLFTLTPLDFLPSLTLIEPYYFYKFFGLDLSSIDGAYWSLFVEVKFYFWACIIYFSLNNRNFLIKSLIFANAVYIITLFGKYFGLGYGITSSLFFPNNLPWFVAGISFYFLYIMTNNILAHMAIAQSMIILIIMAIYTSAYAEIPFYFIFFILFYSFIYKPQWLNFFSYKPLTMIGTSSYSLYLLHQNLGVTLIAYFNKLINSQSLIFMISISFFIMIIMIIISMLVYRFWEYPIIKIVHQKILN